VSEQIKPVSLKIHFAHALTLWRAKVLYCDEHAPPRAGEGILMRQSSHRFSIRTYRDIVTAMAMHRAHILPSDSDYLLSLLSNLKDESDSDDDFEGTTVDMECSSKPRECWLDSARRGGIWALSPVPSPVEPNAECFQTAIKEGKKTLLQSTLLHAEQSSPPSLTSPASTDVGRCVL